MTAAPELSIRPAEGLIDTDRLIRVTGLRPGQAVTIRTATPRGQGAPWRSEAVFAAGDDGSVDLSRDAPVSGSYSGIAPMGLIWSQTGTGALFPDDITQPLVTSVTAVADDALIARATLTQHLCGPGVTRHEVAQDGLVGTMFRPAGPGPHPAIMILNGSGGGINEPRAALWASHGVTALALGYFGAPGLPRYISNTPLEYFARGLDWLRDHSAPAGGFVAVSGQSRGGELALLLGATWPDKVSAVMAYVPSAFVHGGQAAADPALGRDGPCWTLNGQPLVHQWQDNNAASWAPYDRAPGERRNSHAMRTAMGDPAAMARARIPVERIAGPVLLVSGGDDGAWPSDLYALIVQSSLIAAGHRWPVRWVNTPAAGHSILFPHVPTTAIAHRHPVSGISTTMGGTPCANAAANATAWSTARSFLREASGWFGNDRLAWKHRITSL